MNQPIQSNLSIQSNHIINCDNSSGENGEIGYGLDMDCWTQLENLKEIKESSWVE